MHRIARRPPGLLGEPRGGHRIGRIARRDIRRRCFKNAKYLGFTGIELMAYRSETSERVRRLEMASGVEVRGVRAQFWWRTTTLAEKIGMERVFADIIG